MTQRKLLLGWRIAWWIAAVAGAWLPGVMTLIGGRAAGFVDEYETVFIAAAAALLVVSCREMVFWMARTAGGFQGWRLGMLLLPWVLPIWYPMESFHYGVLLSGEKRWRRRLYSLTAIPAALVPAALVVLAMLAYVLGPEGWTLPYWTALMVWSALFAIAGGQLNRVAWRREVEPTSRRRRLRQLAGLLIIGWGVPLAWWGYHYGRLFWYWREAIAIVDAAAVDGRNWDLPRWNDDNTDPELLDLKRKLERTYLSAGFSSPRNEERYRRELTEAGTLLDEFDRWLYGDFGPEWIDSGLCSRMFDLYSALAAEAMAERDAGALMRCLERVAQLYRREYSKQTCEWRIFPFFSGIVYGGGLTLLDDAQLAAVGRMPFLNEEASSVEYRRLIGSIRYLYSPGRHGAAIRPELWRPWRIGQRADCVEYSLWCIGQLNVDATLRPPEPELERESWPASLVESANNAENALQARDRRVARSRMIRLALGLEEYRRSHGAYPAALGELNCRLPTAPGSGLPPEYFEVTGNRNSVANLLPGNMFWLLRNYYDLEYRDEIRLLCFGFRGGASEYGLMTIPLEIIRKPK